MVTKYLLRFLHSIDETDINKTSISSRSFIHEGITMSAGRQDSEIAAEM